MKICFQALYDITNEIAYDIQEHNHPDVQALLHLRKAVLKNALIFIHYFLLYPFFLIRSTWQQICGEALKSMFHFQWAGFCKALFVESKWYNEGYFPSLQEYLSNALISSGGTVISVHSMLSVEHNIADDMVNLLGKNHDLVHNVSIIIRLCNDLGTSAVIAYSFTKRKTGKNLSGYNSYYSMNDLISNRQRKREAMLHHQSCATCEKWMFRRKKVRSISRTR